MDLLVFKAKDSTSFRLSTKYGSIIVPSYFKDCNGYSQDMMNILRTHPNVEIKIKEESKVVPNPPKVKMVGFTLTPEISDSIELTIGQKKTFLIGAKPSTAVIKNLKSFVADKKIAKLSGGQAIDITGIKQGRTVITLLADEVNQEIEVLVYEAPKFKEDNRNCFVGEPLTFELEHQHDFKFNQESNDEYSIDNKTVTFTEPGEYILSTTVRDEEISVVITVKEKENEHES